LQVVKKNITVKQPDAPDFTLINQKISELLNAKKALSSKIIPW